MIQDHVHTLLRAYFWPMIFSDCTSACFIVARSWVFSDLSHYVTYFGR